MKLSDLGFPKEFREIFGGTDLTLYEHQESAIRNLAEGGNVVVSVPTASGKSLIAYVAIYNEFTRGGKALYIVPLRALASEKFEDLKKLRSLGIKVGISVGDYDESPDFIKRYDVIVCTSEKADSLFHHDPSALLEISLVVADELHLIGDESRGPRLEMFLSALRFVNPDARILGLSATITNIDEISSWLSAKSVVSDFRPVVLKTGVVFKKNLEYRDGDSIQLKGKDEVVGICEHFVSQGGQVLVFVNSRKRAEELARRLSLSIDRGLLGNSDIKYIPTESDRFEQMVGTLLPTGVCFHHAGLSNSQRSTIEGLFRERKIKVLVATPTLAAGVNLPARTVLVRDITRFSDGTVGYISNTEVHQMLGRAGRPGYDKLGYGLVYASSENAEEIAREYLESEPEPLLSSLGRESLVRFNAVALISTGLCADAEGIQRFYDKTLFGQQNDVTSLDGMLKRSLTFLSENGFIREKNGRFSSSELGKAVSDLYIDPVSALTLKKYLESGTISDERSLLYISMTPEVTPFYTNSEDNVEIDHFLDKLDVELSEFPQDYYGRVKTSMVLLDWISEVSMDKMEERFRIWPGDVQARVSSADWISYCLARLSSMYLPERRKYFELLNVRISEGIREEIWELTAIPNIGRVRARRLYNAGLRTLQDVAETSSANISRIPGFSGTLSTDTIEQAKVIVSRRRV